MSTDSLYLYSTASSLPDSHIAGYKKTINQEVNKTNEENPGLTAGQCSLANRQKGILAEPAICTPCHPIFILPG